MRAVRSSPATPERWTRHAHLESQPPTGETRDDAHTRATHAAHAQKACVHAGHASIWLRSRRKRVRGCRCDGKQARACSRAHLGKCCALFPRTKCIALHSAQQYRPAARQGKLSGGCQRAQAGCLGRTRRPHLERRAVAACRLARQLSPPKSPQKVKKTCNSMTFARKSTNKHAAAVPGGFARPQLTWARGADATATSGRTLQQL